MALAASITTESLIERIDFFRADANRRLDPEKRISFGQFMTPPSVARIMADLFSTHRTAYNLIDAGAGIGSLSAAFVEHVCRSEHRPQFVSVTAFEADPLMLEYLRSTLDLCADHCRLNGIAFSSEIVQGDFIEVAGQRISDCIFTSPETFDCAILNPPYRKINSNSDARHMLRVLGIETSNLYTAFLSLVMRMLSPGGEMVAITPRSFCNGPYFKPFREDLLRAMALTDITVFESRKRAFSDDDVLQENVIFRGVKGAEPQSVTLTCMHGPEDTAPEQQKVPYDRVVAPSDLDAFIHITTDDLSHQIAEQVGRFSHTLEDLSLTVSTGRVVDFRAKAFLREEPGIDTAPLIYPTHFSHGFIKWPKENSRKPNAIESNRLTADLLVPAGNYVLVKRFSTKEEKRRIVAAIYDHNHISAPMIGFENHLNYYHSAGKGLLPILAKGLAAFLNSTLVDEYFRNFNGHTQVNATDLRSFKYPSSEVLQSLGERIGATFPDQAGVDRLMEEIVMADDGNTPIQAKAKIAEAMQVLKAVGLPKAQQNERSGLTLLSLLNLTPTDPWVNASAPMRGITQMMEFFSENYGKKYAPNSRETVRRQTVHQFMSAGMIVANPDEPARPINSGKTVYQMDPVALALFKTFGSAEWEPALKKYLASVETLAKRYAQAREMERIPLTLPGGQTITLSPGGQNVLVEQIMLHFCPRYTPGGKPIYVGDTDEKWAFYDKASLDALGVVIEQHGKMPDVIIHHTAKNWLILIEAVTSHGPVNPKRHDELKKLFGKSTAGLVFVTTFLTRKDMGHYLSEISWETEVWVADAPDHMMHFNGERFLGPY